MKVTIEYDDGSKEIYEGVVESVHVEKAAYIVSNMAGRSQIKTDDTGLVTIKMHYHNGPRG